MFSGIIEEAATVVGLKKDKGNLHITLKCSFTNELKVDQSVAHNGVCLTVVSIEDDTYTVTAIKETLDISNIGLLEPGSKVNLERSLKIRQLCVRMSPRQTAAGIIHLSTSSIKKWRRKAI